MTIEQTAKICHEVNRALCAAAGDDSQPSWENAPDWMKQSVITGIKYALDNPDATPEQQHEAWAKHKTEQGWVYGEVKDADKKTHPCLKPYAELSFQDKVKDHTFRAIVFSCPIFTVNQPYKTRGEELVRPAFNPSKFPVVDAIKEQTTTLIDFLQEQINAQDKSDPKAGERIAEYTLAIRDIHRGSMQAVSAATFGL